MRKNWVHFVPNDYVMVFSHFGVTTQIPPAPVYCWKTNRMKYLVVLLQVLKFMF